MTNIKFRGFNKKTKKMLDLRTITPLALDSKLNQDGLFLPFHDDIELMQSIGARDSEGVEIFEGDIVEYIENLPVEPEKRISLVGSIRSVDYANNSILYPFINIGSFCYKNNQITGVLNDPKQSKIIGNIWETPELLSEISQIALREREPTLNNN